MSFASPLEMRNYRLGSAEDGLQNNVYDAVELLISEFHYRLGDAAPRVVHPDIYVTVFFRAKSRRFSRSLLRVTSATTGIALDPVWAATCFSSFSRLAAMTSW